MEANLLKAVETNGRPLVLSHRGSALEYPENTILAFERSLEEGADGIELDIQLSADGEPVVFHDDTLDRMTDATGTIGSLSLAGIRELSLPRNQKIPTLRETLALFAGRTQLLLEFKDPLAVEPAVALLRTKQTAGINFCSFYPEVVATCRELLPEVPAFLNTGSLHWKPKGLWREHFPEKTALECGASGISCYHRFLNHRQARAAQAAGGPLMTWCGLFDEKNDVSWLNNAMRYSPRAVITARPVEALQFFEKRKVVS